MVKKYVSVIVVLLLLCFAGCSSGVSNSGANGQEVPGDSVDSTLLPVPGDSSAGTPVTGERTTLVLYFAGADGNLVPVQRDVPKVPGIARKAMEELCLGPQTDGLIGTMPQGTRLLDINIRDNVCTVDFSQELVENHPGGSSGELLTVYSIVNTLTQFPTVEKVFIRVGGQEVQTLAGHLDLGMPLERNADILRN